MANSNGISFDDQPPKWQWEALRQLERSDRLRVVLQDGRTTSGQITTVEEAPSSNSPEEVYVQYLDHESSLRDDDRPHHAVEITRSQEGDYSRAELTLAYTDMGRVRRKTAGQVAWILPCYHRLCSKNLLSRDEAKLALMKDVGISTEEITVAVNGDETDVQSALTSIREKYREAKQTVNRLESLNIELEPYKENRTTDLENDDLEVEEWHAFSNDSDTE